MNKFFVIRNEATYGYYSGKNGFTGLANAMRYQTEKDAVYAIEHSEDLVHIYLTIMPIYHI